MKNTVIHESMPVEYKNARSRRKNFELQTAYVPNPDDATIRGIVFMGLGAEGRLPDKAARRAGKLGLTGVMFVQGLPYHRAHPQKEELIEFGTQTGLSVVRNIRDSKRAPKVLHAIGESQNGEVPVQMALRDKKALDGSVILLHPIGVVTPMSGKEFLGRTMKTGRQRDQRNWTAQVGIGGRGLVRVGQDFLRTGDEHLAQFKAVTQEIKTGEALQTIRTEQPERPVFVVIGEDDALVPLQEAYDNIKPYGVENMLRVIHGRQHSSPALWGGADQVVQSSQQWTADVLPPYVPLTT